MLLFVMMNDANAIHVFERAGLGKAPFRCIGFAIETYQACHGAPILPGTSCDYCRQGIMNVFRIKSADGKTFKVGCDCVEKTGDKGLRKVVNKLKLQHDRALREKRNAAILANLDVALKDESIRTALAAMPHPKGFDNLTALDFADFMFTRAGAKGRAQVAKLLKSIQ